MLIGLPLLGIDEQNVDLMIISVLGAMFISIGAMAVYTVGSESRYCKKIGGIVYGSTSRKTHEKN